MLSLRLAYFLMTLGRQSYIPCQYPSRHSFLWNLIIYLTCISLIDPFCLSHILDIQRSSSSSYSSFLLENYVRPFAFLFHRTYAWPVSLILAVCIDFSIERNERMMFDLKHTRKPSNCFKKQSCLTLGRALFQPRGHHVKPRSAEASESITHPARSRVREDT